MPFQDRMVMRKSELRFLFHVTGETHFRILPGIDDLVAFTAAVLGMQAARPMAHLAAFYFDAFHRDSDPFVGSELEIPDLFFMTRAAGLCSHIGGAGHLMAFENCLKGLDINVAAGRKEGGAT
jgi:hypothetical protein